MWGLASRWAIFLHMELSLALRQIIPEGIARSDMQSLVMEHFDEMLAMSAPEVSHALKLSAFENPDITLYGMRQEGQLLGCGALKQLDQCTGEIKTMRVVAAARGTGIGGFMLDHLMAEAARREYRSVYLETGSEDFFEPARVLYRSRGFIECGPFAGYRADPHSVFMVLDFGESI